MKNRINMRKLEYKGNNFEYLGYSLHTDEDQFYLIDQYDYTYPVSAAATILLYSLITDIFQDSNQEDNIRTSWEILKNEINILIIN